MRFLLQPFEADRQAGWPFWFHARFFAVFFFCLGAFCLNSCLRNFLHLCVRRGVLALVLIYLFCGQDLWAQQASNAAVANVVPWNAVGPAGGDARAIAAVPGQPSHLYLGTTCSWLYESLDAGATWHRLFNLGRRGAMHARLRRCRDSPAISTWGQPAAGCMNRWTQAPHGIGLPSWTRRTTWFWITLLWTPQIVPRFLWPDGGALTVACG